MKASSHHHHLIISITSIAHIAILDEVIIVIIFIHIILKEWPETERGSSSNARHLAPPKKQRWIFHRVGPE
jgi:hypothetical protein